MSFHRSTDRRSKLISAPTNFNHISHMGPGEGIQQQRLFDLPTTIETADHTQQHQMLQQQQRIGSGGASSLTSSSASIAGAVGAAGGGGGGAASVRHAPPPPRGPPPPSRAGSAGSHASGVGAGLPPAYNGKHKSSPISQTYILYFIYSHHWIA